MAKSKQPRLGRGLNSLMSTSVPVDPPEHEEQTADPGSGEPSEATASSEQGAQASSSAGSSRKKANRKKARLPESAPAEEPAKEQASQPAREQGGEPEPEPKQEPGQDPEGLQRIEVERVESNPHQPRQTFDEAALDQLAQSIRQDGVMQPIVVRPHPSTRRKGKYQLVAGERRLLAARRVGLAVIPAIVRRLDDQKLAEWAVIENLQREDLNPIERAEAFNRLIDRFRLSHQQVADRVGVNRPTISNFLRILDLHKDVRELVRSGQLSGGHARALLGLSDAEAQLQLAKKATAGAWSVRAVERAVRQAQRAAEPASSQKGGKTPGSRSAHRADLEQQAAEQLGTKVRIKPGRKKNSGTLSIEFYDLDQFDRLMQALGVNIE